MADYAFLGPISVKCVESLMSYDDVDKSSNKSKCDFWELKLSYILFYQHKYKKVARYACKECEKKGVTKSYTQSHNLKSHIQKLHGTVVWLKNCF